ncbi:MAG: hypothetical protein H6R26_958 [Proteobacteria bacterium]|jgi:hypothetical protein|nr:hypothetical protein [Pseudomonadota bacterium]
MEPLEQTSTVHMIPTIQELALCNGGIEGKTAGYSDYTVGKLALPCADSVADLRAAGRSADDAREVAIWEPYRSGHFPCWTLLTIFPIGLQCVWV